MSRILTSLRKVIFKLSGFSLAMVTLPLLTYFATVNKVFDGTDCHVLVVQIPS